MQNKEKDICKDIEKHFLKYKNFYISILISLVIIFVWCKWGRKILEKIEVTDTLNKNNNNSINLTGENKYYNQEIVNEITDILRKIN